MDSIKIARQLIDCDDVEFAEVFVAWFKMWCGDKITYLSKADMIGADVDVITGKINDILNEVLFSEETVTYAWWKKGKDFLDDQEKMADLFELTKDEFLESYSYLTEEEYDETVEKAIELLKERRN